MHIFDFFRDIFSVFGDFSTECREYKNYLGDFRRAFFLFGFFEERGILRERRRRLVRSGKCQKQELVGHN